LNKKLSTIKKTSSLFLATILFTGIIAAISSPSLSFITVEKAQAELPDFVTKMLKSNLPRDNNINNNNNLFSPEDSDLSNDLETTQRPPGSQGPPISPGPPVRFDLDSTYVVEQIRGPFGITPGSTSGIATLTSCDEGDKIISGGYSTDSITENLLTSIDRPFFNEFGFDTEGWHIGFIVTGPVEEVTMYAYCFDNSPEHIP
jgi:hypothetical protein